MSQFGEDHREEVQSTLEGNIAPVKEQQLKSSLSSKGQKETIVQPRTKFNKTAALAEFGNNLLGRAAKAHNVEEFSKGFAVGTVDGYAELEKNESGIKQFLFGKSARLRGAQSRMVQDRADDLYTGGLRSMERDSRKLSTEDYHNDLLSRLDVALEPFDDPEMRQLITERFSKDARSLAANHTKKRHIWEAAEEKRSMEDSILSGVTRLNTAEKHGDQVDPDVERTALLESVTYNEERLGDLMSPQAFSDVVTASVVKSFQRNDSNLYDLLDNEGLLTEQTANNQETIRDAKEVYEKRFETNYHTQAAELARMAANGTEGARAIAQGFSRKYPNTFDLPAWQRDYDKNEQVRREKQQKIATDVSLITSNAPESRLLDMKESRAAFNQILDQLGRQGVVQDKHQAVADARANGETLMSIDPNASPTPQEIDEWVRDNPQATVPIWRRTQVRLPQLEQSLSSTLQLLNSPTGTLTDDNLENIRKQMAFADNFRVADEKHFSKHFASTSEQLRYEAMHLWVKRAGFPPRNGIELLRAMDIKPPVTETPYEDMVNAREDILDSFIEEKGDQWFGFISREPENVEVFYAHADAAFNKAYRLFKGDVSLAKKAVKSIMLREGTTIGNTFVPGGAVLDKNSNNGSVNNYLKGWDVNNPFKKTIWRESGFVENDSMLDEKFNYMPSQDGKSIVITDPETSSTLPLLLPTNKKDLRPFGTINYFGNLTSLSDTRDK